MLRDFHMLIPCSARKASTVIGKVDHKNNNRSNQSVHLCVNSERKIPPTVISDGITVLKLKKLIKWKSIVESPYKHSGRLMAIEVDRSP